MIKTIYLASGYAKLKAENVTYNDLVVPRENRQHMLDVDLTQYDILIATPPCNFYSYARGASPPSKYALETAHLLLEIIIKFHETGKPFIVENVTNKTTLDFIWAMSADLGLYRFKHARHTYITNIMFDVRSVAEEFDFDSSQKLLNPFNDRQGGYQVSAVFDCFVKAAKSNIAQKAGKAHEPGKAAKAQNPAGPGEASQTSKASQIIDSARLELKRRLAQFGGDK